MKRRLLDNPGLLIASGVVGGSLPIPAAPTLDAVPTNDLTPAITWSEPDHATKYHIQISLVSNFASTVFDVGEDGSLTDPTYTPTSDLVNMTVYYARVRAGNPAGWSAWSDTATWTVAYYALRDELSTAAAAPLGATVNSDPGPGILTKFADTGNNASIAGGELVIAAAVGDVDPAYYWTDGEGAGFARAAGLALVVEETGTAWVGWSNSATIAAAAIAHGIKGTSAITGGVEGVSVLPASDTKYVILLDTSGAKLLYKSGDEYKLAFVWTLNTGTPLWPAVLGSVANYPSMRTFPLTGRWIGTGLATTNIGNNVANGTTFSHNAKSIITFKLTNKGTSGDANEIHFRKQDDQNYFMLTPSWTGDLRFIRYAGGVININNDLGSCVNGDEYAIVLSDNPDTISIYQNGTRVKLQSGGGFTASTGGKVVVATNGDIDNMVVWPVEVAAPYPFDAELTGLRSIAICGDSKSVDGTWPERLVNLLEMSTGNNWQAVDNFAVAGDDVTEADNHIDADLTAATSTPEIVWCNYGANDVAVPLNEATFKASYAYIIEAVHTKWPSADLYLTLPWRRTYDAACDTMAGWIGDLIALYAYCHQGDDERDWMEAGDNGVTYTSDGVHPTDAGYTLAAQQRKAVLGL